MKAPDKIYICSCDSSLERGFATASVEKMKSNAIEYINKNALLEWIDEYENYSSGPSWELLKTHIETL